MDEGDCHHRGKVHDIIIWIIWIILQTAQVHFPLCMLFLSSPISFSPGEARNVGEGTEMFGNLLCCICYIPKVITEIVFLPFSDFLVIKDRAGIQDCFITLLLLWDYSLWEMIIPASLKPNCEVVY